MGGTSGAVEYDYEIPPFNPPHACFDQRCLVKFRQFSKLGNDGKITREIVLKEYREQWIDFMAYRAAVLLKKIKKAVHTANPDVHFTVYSGYYNAKNNTTKKRYGIDWNVVGKMQSIDEAGMGYGRKYESIKDSIKALRGIPVKFGALLRPYDMQSRRAVAPLTDAKLLRRALDATGGVLIYSRTGMDGRTWTAIANISRLTADYEPLFLDKTLEDIKGQDPDKVQLAKGPKQSLLCIMNPSNTKSTFSFAVPGHLGAGKGYYSKQKIKGGENLNLTLQPGAVRVFAFQRQTVNN